jgi:surface protein
MSDLWVTFSSNNSGTFTELSGNIIYNLNNFYNFNRNLVDTTSNFIIYELTNHPIQGGVSLQANNWKRLNLNTILKPFQGYWLGGINTNLPQIFTNTSELQTAVNNWKTNPISVTNIYGNISNWDVGNVTNMASVFLGASSFNGNISSWDVGNVTNMAGMFINATNFNQYLNEWNVGNVTNMSSMFLGASSFNGNISSWDVGNVINISNMFHGATNFNGNISNWDVGNVTNMSMMFINATNFNGNISNWDVGNVTNMRAMFIGANTFNQDISSWDVGNVTTMSQMFSGATSFNGNISNWDVGNVTEGGLDFMFKDITFFTNQTDKIHSNGTPFNYFNSQRT